MMHVNANLMGLIVGTFVCLVVGTGIRLFAVRKFSGEIAKQRLASLKVWWILAILLCLAALFGQLGATVLIAVASALGLREYLRLVDTNERIGHTTLVCLLILGTAHFGMILFGAGDQARWMFPAGALLMFGAVRALAGKTGKYIRVTAGIYWGAMLFIFALSHSLFLFDIETGSEPAVGPAGWFLYLVLLTEMNDIMQAIVGRKLGRHKLTPEVSPNKSLEGLLGGLITTIILSAILAPHLTTLGSGRSPLQGFTLSVVAGILISISGFLGDINMSAIKRDAGVKDGSSLFPGMGGMIDRIDSLIYSSPVFYYFIVFVMQSEGAA